ncbi:MAG: ATP-binding protein [Deltaproteobacteria bacterium]|nr:ATP-binding protein [Deltaproteobacteria bacterium]
MFQRALTDYFLRAVKSFPVIILTGARQTGKSTLCQSLLHTSHAYVSLEDPDVRALALQDPRTFLQIHPPPVIFDEIQYAPDLPSYLQGIVDADRHTYGQYVLTGSQNFLLMERVSQSLAGRAALLTLYPCSVDEVDGGDASPRSTPDAVADWILRGGYPELRARPELDRRTWCASYIRLFLERDVRQLTNVGDLDTFERFLRLVVLRTGQILNVSELGRDAGVSQPTAQRWLSILQASYQIFLLRPFHANLSKRLIKAPKLYFADTALATYLMGIHDPATLIHGPSYGALFETAVIMEHLKWAAQRGDMPALTFFRTKEGVEIDCFIEQGQTLYAREIKSTRTLVPQLAEPLRIVETLLRRPLKKEILAPVGTESALGADIRVRPWHHVAWA